MGIRAHSLPGKYVIFCVGQDPYRIAAFHAYIESQQLGVKQVLGCYKGQQEISFVSTEETFNKLRHWVKKEEAVLMLHEPDAHGYRLADLVFKDRIERVGKWHGCSSKEAMAHGAWTYDPTYDAYFICET